MKIVGGPTVAQQTDIKAIGEWKTNADMIAEVAQLGYITGAVLDLTYGEGGFWKVFRPQSLVTNDLNPEKDSLFHYDFRETPFSDNGFDTVVLDPPYKLQGTAASGEMDNRYGTEEYRSRSSVVSLLLNGMTEGMRVSREWLLVKTMDQVNGGKVRWMTDDATFHAEAFGWRKVDSFLFRGGRPQPAGRSQQHARRNYSTLLVFGRR